MKLDVESLRAFCAVVDEGGFTEAAHRVGMTQSAVSWKIKRLEERIGRDLVKRGPRAEATPHGRDLIPYARQIVEAHDEAVSRLSGSDLDGVVRLGTNEDLHGPALSETLAQFGRRHPGVRLDIRVHLSGTVRDWLDDGVVDLAVLQLPPAAVEPDDHVLWTESLAWYRARTAEFSADHVVPVVSFGSGLAYEDSLSHSLSSQNIRWRTALESPMVSSVISAVEAGLGVGLLNARNVTPGMVPWEGASQMDPMEVAYVIRTGSTVDTDVTEALRDALVNSLGVRAAVANG